MSSRSARTRNGHVTTSEFKTIRTLHEGKVLIGTGNNHGLPDYSHTPNRIYIKEYHDDTLREMRAYGSDGFPLVEIGYHPEPRITGNRHDKVLHYHEFDSDLGRSKAERITPELQEKYGKYLRGYGL